MDHGRPTRAHHERRLLGDLVADGHDHVGLVDRHVHVIALGQRRGAHVQARTTGHRALAHLRGEERNAGAQHERRQRFAGLRPRRRRGDHQQGALGVADDLRRPIQRLRTGNGTIHRVRRNQRHALDLIGRDIFGQLQQHRARALFLGDTERLADDGRDGARRHDLPRLLGQRLHRADDVDDLEARLLAGDDALLPGDHDDRPCAKQRIRGAGGEIQRAGAERGQAHARLAGQAAIGGRHEHRRLLVAGDDQLDAGMAQRLDHVEIFFAGNAENALDAFVLKCGDKQI